MMNIEHVSELMRRFSEDVELALKFYADDCDFTDHPLEQKIINDKAKLRRAFIPFANKDPGNGMGIHHFDALEYIGNEQSGLLQWQWTADHCASIFGLSNPDGRRLSTNGMSFYVFHDGKIVREVVHSNQLEILRQLGHSIEIEHFWEDPSFA